MSRSLRSALLTRVRKLAARSPAETLPRNSQFLRPRPPKRRCPHLLHQLFDLVVVNRQPAVAEILSQRVPMVAEVVQGLGDFLFGQDLLRGLAVEPFAQAIPEGLRLGGAERLTVGGRQRASAVFHVVQLLIQRQELTGQQRVIVARIEELASGVRVARRANDA